MGFCALSMLSRNCVSYPLSFSVPFFYVSKSRTLNIFNLNTRVQSLFFLYIWALQHLFVKKYEKHQMSSIPFQPETHKRQTRQRHSDFTTTTFHVSFPYLRNTPRLREVFVVLLGGSETQASTDRQLRYDIARWKKKGTTSFGHCFCFFSPEPSNVWGILGWEGFFLRKAGNMNFLEEFEDVFGDVGVGFPLYTSEN